MRGIESIALAAAATMAAGCIYVTINFPEAEIRDAAAHIVDEVHSDDASAEPQGGAKAVPASRQDAGPDVRSTGGVFGLFHPGIAFAAERTAREQSAAFEEHKIQIDVSTPVIKAIKETLKRRYAKLLPFYEKGAVGEGKNGSLAERDMDKLSLKEKRDCQALLKEENDDRKNLYVEICRANKIDESKAAAVGELFGAEWQRKAKAGWWVEVEKGKWEKKPEEKKKE